MLSVSWPHRVQVEMHTKYLVKFVDKMRDLKYNIGGKVMSDKGFVFINQERSL